MLRAFVPPIGVDGLAAERSPSVLHRVESNSTYRDVAYPGPKLAAMRSTPRMERA